MGYPKPLHWWTENVLPLVYDESLSYYEVMSKIVTYINGITQDTIQTKELVEEIKELVENAGYNTIPEILARLDELDATITSLNADNAQNKADIATLKTDNTQNKADIAELKTDITTLKTDNTQNKADIAELKTDNTQNKADITTLKTDNTQNKADISTLETDNTQNKADISTLETDNMQNKADIAELKTDNTQNKADITTLKTDNTQNKADISVLKTDNTQNKADIVDLKSALINKQYISGSNLFNKSDSENTDGTYINSMGNISTGSTTYGLSDYIPVTEGLTYAYKSRQGGTKNSWYDINKNKISDFSNETGHPIIATAPEGAYYVRLTYGIAEKNATQFNQSETLLAYSAYTEYAVEAELRKLTKINPDDYAKASAVDSKVDKTITSVNLFNKNASGIVSDHYLNSSGNEAGSTSYSISDYIPVTPGKTYGYLSRAGGTYNWFYDENKTIMFGASGGDFDCNNMPKIVTAPSGAAFVRLSFGNAEKDTTIFAEGDTVPAYVPYYEIDSEEQIKKVYNSDINASGQAISMVGTSGIIVKSDTLSANGTLNVTSFPYYLKKNVGMSFYGKFSAFTGLRIGKGYNSYRGDWIAIDTTNVVFHHYESADQTKKTVAHGLTFSDYIMVNVYFDEDCDIIVKIDTVSGSFTTKRETDSDVFSGLPFVTALSAMTNAQLSIQSGDLRKPLWVIGDSYFGVTSDRVLGQLKALGYWNGYAADGLAGLGSAEAFNELQRMLSFGKPKFLVWYLGMNDSDTTFTTYLSSVIEVCQTNDIVLILNKIPTVPQRDKETIGAAVVASGKRYIDSYTAVGTNSSGQWYTGFIESGTNPVHPTVRGAEALAQRFVLDVPEIMMYGYNEAEVTGLSVGDN